jgi:hypothetical protein
MSPLFTAKLSAIHLVTFLWLFYVPIELYLKVEFNSTCTISRKLIFPYFFNPLHSAPMVRMNVLVYATCFADAARWECAQFSDFSITVLLFI